MNSSIAPSTIDSSSSLPESVWEISSIMPLSSAFIRVRSSRATEADKQKVTMTIAPYASSHLVSVLSADLLAQELGINERQPDPSLQAKNTRWQHILWLQSLESGGSVMKRENFLRSGIRYSGGTVSTYALFSLGGELECSGNVFDYGGPILAKDFQEQIPHGDFDPLKEILLEGGCQAVQPPADQ
jgi:hypothetical protein